MSRAAVLAVLFAIAPADVCGKIKGKHGAVPSATVEPTPPPLPITSATAPPIWSPPDTGEPPPSPTPSAAANPDLTKARLFAQQGEHRKVRALLEKKVKAGKATQEEAAVLIEACTALKDKTCIAEVKAKHPDLEDP